MLKHLFLSVALVTSAPVIVPAIALACGNAMFVDGDDAVKQIMQAEKLLARGQNKQALKLVGYKYRFESNQQEKVQLIRATAAFRSLKVSNYLVSNGIENLKSNLKTNQDNPLLLARLAEGYALSKKDSAKAKTILEDLATRDLMPDGFAFATLAKLRSQSGETESAKAAIQSCKSMLKKKSLCTRTQKKGNSAPMPRNRSKGRKFGANAS